MSTPSPRLWRLPGYPIWLASDTAKGLAHTLFSFALPLIALLITDDPAQAGLIAGIGLTARVLLTFVGGVLADRHRRIVLMLLGSLLGIALSAGFTFLALTGSLSFWTLLVIEVLLGARGGLFDVAGESALKEIVPPEAMGSAQAANQARDAALQLAGGPLGGALLAAGAGLVGTVMTLCHAVAAVTAWLLHRTVRTPPPRAQRTRGTSGAWSEMKEGFSWLFARPDLRPVLLVSTIINLGFNTVVTTVIYGLQQSGHSELVIGWLSATAGVAMLIGAVLAPLAVRRLGAGSIALGGLICVTVFSALVATTQELWLIVLVMCVGILPLPAVNAGLLGYFMVATPSELLGRANSALGILAMGAMPLGPLVAGFGISLIGRDATIVVGAGICAISAVLAGSHRELRRLPSEPSWARHAAGFGSVTAPPQKP